MTFTVEQLTKRGRSVVSKTREKETYNLKKSVQKHYEPFREVVCIIISHL